MGRVSASTVGTAAYTVGQRQGLGVALGQPRYVSRIDPLSNTIQLGRREDLETHEFTVERASFIAAAAPPIPFQRLGSHPPSGRPDRGDREPDRRPALGGEHQ